jgi:hypothetical protein
MIGKSTLLLILKIFLVPNSKVNNYCTISTIHVPSYDDMFDEYALRNSCSLACDNTKPLVYDGYDDEYNIFSSPIF